MMLVLLDVALPDGDGLDLLSRLRVAGNDTAVLMMSGHATIDASGPRDEAWRARLPGKPLSTDRLLVMLENALRLLHAEAEARELHAEAGTSTT